jgi:adenylate kinase
MANIIFMGPPGSGKGTQSSMLAKKLKIPTISTGDVLRNEAAMRTEIGIMAQDYMNAGKLVPDFVVIDIIRGRISQSDCDDGFIVDGFPRTIDQAIAFDEMLESLGKKINAVINFEAIDDVLVKRISGRFSCSSCGAIYNSYFKPTKKQGVCDSCGSNEFESRPDDNIVSVKKRLQIYHESSSNLIEHYKKKNLLYSIDALKEMPLIFEKLVEIAQKFYVR